jgi:hypothetical protein
MCVNNHSNFLFATVLVERKKPWMEDLRMLPFGTQTYGPVKAEKNNVVCDTCVKGVTDSSYSVNTFNSKIQGLRFQDSNIRKFQHSFSFRSYSFSLLLLLHPNRGSGSSTRDSISVCVGLFLLP